MEKRSGQNILEYVVLLAVIVSALLIMQVYIKRAYQGHIKQEADQISTQYSPKHTTSLTVTTTKSITESYTGGKTQERKDSQGKIIVPGDKPIADGMSVSFSSSQSSFEKQEAIDSFNQED